jgi:hypothetical protein
MASKTLPKNHAIYPSERHTKRLDLFNPTAYLRKSAGGGSGPTNSDFSNWNWAEAGTSLWEPPFYNSRSAVLSSYPHAMT